MAEEYVDVIKDGEIQRVTESEARDEGLFILRRPTLVSGNDAKVKPFSPSTPRQVRAGRPSYSLDYSHNNVMSELVDHFNWEISKHRRLKNLTRKQLGDLVGTSEENIKLLETGELPADNFSLITKIEHYLGIVLRKTSSSGSSMGMAKSAAPTNSVSMNSISTRTHSSKLPDNKIVTLAELQKRREASRNKQVPVKSLKEIKSSESISGGDIEIID